MLDGRAKLIQNKPHRNMLSEGALCTGNNAYVCQYIHIHLHLLHGCTTAYIVMYVRMSYSMNVILTIVNINPLSKKDEFSRRKNACQ